MDQTSVAVRFRITPIAMYAYKPDNGYRHLLGYARRMVYDKTWEIITYKHQGGKPVRNKVETCKTQEDAIHILAELVGYYGELPSLSQSR